MKHTSEIVYLFWRSNAAANSSRLRRRYSLGVMP